MPIPTAPPRPSLLLRQLPRRAVIALFCAGTALVAFGAAGWCAVRRAQIDGDTPALCGIYLEQNALVVEQFGHLLGENFQPGRSSAYEDDAAVGRTRGLYTFEVQGDKANGTVQIAWFREGGSNGTLEVPGLQILHLERTAARQRPAPDPRHHKLTPVARSGGLLCRAF